MTIRRNLCTMFNKTRIFYNWIRGYDFGDPERSGEYRFLRSFVRKGMVVFDVGANVGDYTHFIFDVAKGDIEIHCFEPVQETFSKLQQRFNGLNKQQNIYLNNFGLSNREEQRQIKIYGATAGVNSLYERTYARETHPELNIYSEETVSLSTLDAYVDNCEIRHIDLLKIDVEGHEFKVLEGAAKAIEKGKISVIQFEYGGCFLDSDAKLEEIFRLLSRNGYKMFRLLPYGKLRVRRFHSRLENYKFSNWIAMKASVENYIHVNQGIGWRERSKRNPWIAMAWALIRGRQQERRIYRDLKYYRGLAEKHDIPYELDEWTLRERLWERLSSRNILPKQRTNLHVVYATPLGNWEEHNIPPALEQFGTLTPFYLKERGFDSSSPNWFQNRHELDHALIQFMKETTPKADVLVSYLSGWHISPEAINTINQMGIATCAFWWDDRLSFRGTIQGGRYSGSESLASAYDLNLTNASDSIVKYLVKGGLAMFWPEGANPEHFRPLNLPFKYDVSFVGACYGQRPAYINYLRRQGIKVEVFGPGWPNGPVSEDEMVEIYNRSHVNLGFSGIGYSMKEMCLKGRDFEVPMTGALYLTSEQHDLHRVYKVGEEVVTYRGKSDCLAKIRYLLGHEDESKSIREAARKRCVRDHTWVQRFHKVFLMIGLLNA